ncbi:MAG: hypothetical protein ACRDT4_10825 [Micromonosporaceae bacterium]
MNVVLGVLAELRRVNAGPLALRAVALGSGFAAVLLAVPAPVRGPGVWLLAGLLALGAAIGVSTPWVSALEYVAVLVWFATTTIYRYDLDVGQVLGLMFALYLHHSACALAAVLPVDAVVAPRLLRDWALRTGAVLTVSLLAGAVILALPSLTGRSTSVWVPVAGLVALLAAGYLVVRLARRT